MGASLRGLRYDSLMERIVTLTTLSQKKRDAQSRDSADLAYWLSRPVTERIAAVELLRQAHISTLPDAEQRLQRVCRVIQRPRG